MMRTTLRTDVAVIGGGLAGICAAVAAARRGRQVVLVQNRPVLGGNSSSEVRVWVCGATAHGTHLNARETGIMGELFVENQFRNPDGNPCYWDLLLLETVRAEDGITLLLNTDVTEVDADGPEHRRTIRAVTGWTSGSERRTTIHAGTFIDCTGDGLVGHLAGARSMSGREPRSAFDESWAPEVPDDNMLGSTILFASHDTGRPQKFVPPSFAVDIGATSIPEHRVIRQDMSGCAFWWIEWGGELDIVHDNERIRDELQAVCYGLWDHIKNSGRYDAETLTLEWVGSVPGKREYRRFVGDHVLTQQDVLGQRDFADRVAFGGWSIDLHPAGGVYAAESGSRHWHPEGSYHIPLRCLYSANVANLWMAGRNISASHVAFGSTRVMATCAVLGEAAGIAAALAQELDAPPAALAQEHLPELRRALVRADASVLGLENDDPADLARCAEVRASSTTTRLASSRSTGHRELVDDIALVLPVRPRLDGLEILLDAAEATQLHVALHRTRLPQNYLPHEEIDRAVVPVAEGRSWVRLPLRWEPAEARNAVVVLRANPLLGVHIGAEAVPGVLVLGHRDLPPAERFTEQWRAWKQTLHRRGICFRLAEPTAALAPSQAVGGFSRPYGGPHLWVSAPLEEDPRPWLELGWASQREVRTVDVLFDDDVDEDLINLHHHRTEAEIPPSLVRDARVEARVAGEWVVLARIRDNRRRRCSIRLGSATPMDRLRLVVEDTHGCREARVVALRAYED